MKVLLAGGGTAGHIEPALAVGRAFVRRDPHCELLFLGTQSGLESTLIPQNGFRLHLIPKVAIARRIHPSLLAVPFQLVRAIASSYRALSGVDVAIGFGGYVSGPLYLAAVLKRTPFLIHEQNARSGWANRMGARFSSHRAISYPVAKGALRSATLTGLPLRDDVIAAFKKSQSDWSTARRQAKVEVAREYGLSDSAPLIFIFGGSQGSQAINTVIAGARTSLTSRGFSIVHGVGAKNALPESDASYRALSYIDQMARLYLAADLIISRSGAVSCAEIAALGKFALFIPLPVGNGEQALNASSLESSGRAEVLPQSEFTIAWLESHIDQLIAKSAALSPAGSPDALDAADTIVSMAIDAAGKR